MRVGTRDGKRVYRRQGYKGIRKTRDMKRETQVRD